MSEKEYYSIKSWSEDDRPREKMIKHGPAHLSKAELIAILFGHGTRETSAVDLARELLKTVDDDLNKLARKSLKELQSINGIGPAKSVALMAALEIGRRRSDNLTEENQISFTRSDIAANYLRPKMQDLNNEIFYVLYLNTKNKILFEETLSIGGITATYVDVRMLFKIAINAFATGIIIGHNHPSGNTTPSESDKALTRKIKEAAHLFDIKLLDHIIIGGHKYFSFADNGLL